MAMLTAAFDCSGVGNQDKYFVMAGFVSPAKHWSDFDRERRARLKADNLAYFHSNPFAHATTHPQKPFDSSWIGAEQRRRDLLKDLLGIIQLHAGRKFGCILPRDVFLMLEKVTREQYAPMQIVLTARLIWGELIDWRRREHKNSAVEMIFEQGDLGKGQLEKAIEEVSGQRPIFRHKKDNPEKSIVAFTPLQASDLLAYEILKVTREQGRPLNEVTIRFPYQELEKLPGDIRMLQSRGAGLIDTWTQVVKYFDENPLPKPTVQ